MIHIEGRNPLLEALRAKSDIQKIYIQKNIPKDNKISEVLKLAKKRKIRLEEVEKSHLDRISQTGVHQGVIGVRGERIAYFNTRELVKKTEEENKIPFYVIIREVLYEYNLGAIIRTAVCAGCNGIIIPQDTEITAEVARGAMGATEHAVIAKDSMFQSLKILHDNAIKLVGIEVTAKNYYYDEDLTGPIALIIGGEDHSLSEEIMKKCDFFVKIPLLSKINSLNMSVASGIVIYDKVRQELKSE